MSRGLHGSCYAVRRASRVIARTTPPPHRKHQSSGLGEVFRIRPYPRRQAVQCGRPYSSGPGSRDQWPGPPNRLESPVTPARFTARAKGPIEPTCHRISATTGSPARAPARLDGGRSYLTVLKPFCRNWGPGWQTTRRGVRDASEVEQPGGRDRARLGRRQVRQECHAAQVMCQARVYAMGLAQKDRPYSVHATVSAALLRFAGFGGVGAAVRQWPISPFPAAVATALASLRHMLKGVLRPRIFRDRWIAIPVKPYNVVGHYIGCVQRGSPNQLCLPSAGVDCCAEIRACHQMI